MIKLLEHACMSFYKILRFLFNFAYIISFILPSYLGRYFNLTPFSLQIIPTSKDMNIHYVASDYKIKYYSKHQPLFSRPESQHLNLNLNLNHVLSCLSLLPFRVLDLGSSAAYLMETMSLLTIYQYGTGDLCMILIRKSLFGASDEEAE